MFWNWKLLILNRIYIYLSIFYVLLSLFALFFFKIKYFCLFGYIICRHWNVYISNRKNCFYAIAIHSTNPGKFFMDDAYFVDVTCFLTFNVFAFLGSLLSAFITWVSEVMNILQLCHSTWNAISFERVKEKMNIVLHYSLVRNDYTLPYYCEQFLYPYFYFVIIE